MRLNKAIKRIIALGTGVTMVGATILGAMAAADLSAYPKPFVDNGAFNALIVVGSNGAKVEDVLGSIDIATSLQYATTKQVAIPGATASASVSGEGIKIEATNDKLQIGEQLQDVNSKIDETELATLLAKGVYVNDGDDESDSFAYTQKIEFPNTAYPSVQFFASNDYTDEDNPYLFLYTPEGDEFLRYTLDFTKLAESKWYTGTTCGSANELCDFEGTKIEIMGINYEVTAAEYDGTSDLTWEMMGGTSLNTMYEGETKTFTIDGVDYEVTVDIISDGESTVVMTVNGVSTKELAKDQTQRVAGIEIGIKKLMSNEAGEEGAGKDLVQFYLGANKVTLSDDVTGTLGDNVILGNDEVDDLFVDWTVDDATPSTGDIFKIQSLELVWVPSEVDLLLAPGDSAKFPGMESFMVNFEGLTGAAKTEMIYLSPNGDDNIELKAPLEGGDLKLNVLYTGGTNFDARGNDDTAGQGKLNIAAGNLSKGDYLLLSASADEESHIVKLENVDDDGIARFQEVTSGTKYEKTCLAGCTIAVGNTDLVLTSATDAALDSVIVAAGSDDSDLIYTKGGMTLDIGAATGATTFDFVFTEADEYGAITNGNVFEITAEVDGGETTVSAVASAGSQLLEDPTSPGTIAFELGETDKFVSMTNFGTKITHDRSGDQDSVVIEYPSEELHAQVFVNTLDAQIENGGEGGATYDQVQKIEVGAAVLDTEVADVTAQNLIVVGGPCVNAVAAELMGNPAECYVGFEDGKAMIKLFEHSNGKVALLVAGAQAMDTRRASRVVAGMVPDKYTGVELEVTGTSLSDIKVSAPATE